MVFLLDLVVTKESNLMQVATRPLIIPKNYTPVHEGF